MYVCKAVVQHPRPCAASHLSAAAVAVQTDCSERARERCFLHASQTMEPQAPAAGLGSVQPGQREPEGHTVPDAVLAGAAESSRDEACTPLNIN
jgi:hypothetical protein